MKETLTVRASVRAALRRGETRLFAVGWLFEQGSQFDWDVFWAKQRAAWVTEHARDLARWEATGRAAEEGVNRAQSNAAYRRMIGKPIEFNFPVLK